MNKKIVSLAMATLLGLSLAACSSGNSSSGSDDAGKTTKTEGTEESGGGSSDVANKDKPLVEWECLCLMHGQRTITYRPSAMTRTATR